MPESIAGDCRVATLLAKTELGWLTGHCERQRGNRFG